MKKLLAAFLAASAACQSPPHHDGQYVASAREFRAHLRAARFDEARAMMTPAPRRWWERRSGEGAPWRVGVRGRWSDWDHVMESESEELGWRQRDREASVLLSEDNRYYRMLERGPQLVRFTYYFDERGRIEGFLIAAEGERPQGETDSYLEWARRHEPEELDYLRPGEAIDPTGDRAERTLAQLSRWRAASGLEPLE